MAEVCKTCKAPIVWAITGTGRLMPVDAEPDPNGNLLLHTAGSIHAIVVPPGARSNFAGELHKAHFATCPYADQHRRRA